MHTFLEYIRYFFRAGNAHGLHSPFVYQLFTEIIDTDKWYYAFDTIEDIRADLLNDTTKITKTDFGAGSKTTTSPQSMVCDIAQSSVSQPYTSQLIFKLIDFFQPKIILELGTSLGINTLYMGFSASSNAAIYTLEGCPQIAQKAQEIYNKIPDIAKQINLVIGNIDQTLPQQLAKLDTVDFVFFDANHRYQATIEYFTKCLEKANPNTVFVLDDIYWSKEMTKAWKEIQQHPKVTITVDLFQIGLVFFQNITQEKQNFVLKFA
jgi:predicted O-methyltransferase YrrM